MEQDGTGRTDRVGLDRTGGTDGTEGSGAIDKTGGKVGTVGTDRIDGTG